jgi:CO/xanthine dehydrogenase FAD-binding subunit
MQKSFSETRGLSPFGPNHLPAAGDLVIDATLTFEDLYQLSQTQNYSALFMALRNVCTIQSQRQKNILQVLSQDSGSQGISAALIALDAQLLLERFGMKRVISMANYLDLEGERLRAGEQIHSIFISKKFRSPSVYQSMEYLRSGQAVCGVAVWAQRYYDTLQEVRIVLSGCTPHPVLLPRISAAMEGKEPGSQQIDEAIRKLGEEKLYLYNPSLTLGSHLFNLTRTLIKRAILTL